MLGNLPVLIEIGCNHKIQNAEPVSPGDSQSQRRFDQSRGIEFQTILTKSVEALAAPGFRRSAVQDFR